jgi:ribosomal protein S27E
MNFFKIVRVLMCHIGMHSYKPSGLFMRFKCEKCGKEVYLVM